MKRALLACVLVGCAPALVWTGRGPARGAAVTVTRDGERWVVEREDGPRATYDEIAFERLAWTPAGVLVPVRRDGAWWMLDGASERGPFVSVGEVVVAGAHSAFVATDASGVRVVVDGTTGAAFDAIEDGVLLDAERGSVAYVGRDARGEHVVHDADVGSAVPLVAMLTMGAKGRSVAWVDRGTRDRLLVDGVEAASYDAVLALVVADGEPHWAALVVDGGTQALVHDGAVRARATYLSHVRLSEDGTHVACLAPAEDGSATDVIVDGARVARHRRVDGDRFGFVPGDPRVVLVSGDAQGVRLTVGDTESERYETIEGPTLAPGRVGFVGRRGERSEIVIDGAVIAAEPWAASLRLAQDGDGWAYVARDAEGRRVVVTPAGRSPVPSPFVDTLVLDAEGRHWAALVPDAASHTLVVWIDGAPGPTVDERELGGALAIADDAALPEVARAVVAGELARAER